MFALLLLRECKPCECRRIFVVLGKCLFEFLLGMVENAFPVVDLAHRSVHLYVVRIDFEGAGNNIAGFLHLIVLQKQVRVPVNCFRPTRLRAERTFIIRQGFLVLADYFHALRNVELQNRMVRVEFQSVKIC